MIHYIYALICPLSNKIKYIGQTKRQLRNRLQSHFDEYQKYKRNNGIRSYKYNWFKKLENLNCLRDLKIQLIEECTNLTVNEREIFWISQYNDLVNISPGGGKHSEESIEKNRRTKIGSKNPMFGKKLTKEHRQKMIDAMKNSQKFKDSRASKEYKQKLSDIFSIPIVLLDENFKLIKEFKNCRECAEYFGCTKGNIKNAVRHKRHIGKKLKKKFWVMRKEEFERIEQNEIIK